jgi:hypothetical protein
MLRRKQLYEVACGPVRGILPGRWLAICSGENRSLVIGLNLGLQIGGVVCINGLQGYIDHAVRPFILFPHLELTHINSRFNPSLHFVELSLYKSDTRNNGPSLHP